MCGLVGMGCWCDLVGEWGGGGGWVGTVAWLVCEGVGVVGEWKGGGGATVGGG